MAWNWSNPTPSDATGAALGSQFRVQADSIGPLIAAIIAQREHKAAQERQALMDIAKGVAGAYSGYQQAQQAGLADDAANRAIYQAQNPYDPYRGQPGYDERVPDYGGTMGYEAQLNADKLRKIEEQLSGTGWQNELQRQLVEARIAKIRSGTGSEDGSAQDSPETYWDDQGREWRRGSGGHWYLIKAAPAPRTPQFKTDAAGREALGSIAPEYPPQTVYTDESAAPQAQSDNPRDYPQVGEIRKGYRFKGGDPADRNNWEKI